MMVLRRSDGILVILSILCVISLITVNMYGRGKNNTSNLEEWRIK
jgi:hypothetical protein